MTSGKLPSWAAPLVLLLATGGATGCAEAKDKREPASGRSHASAPAGDAVSERDSPAAASRAMRITADLTVEAKDVDAAARSIRQAAVDEGGYVGNATYGGPKERRSVDLELKVPSDKLEAFRAAIAEAGAISRSSEKAEDVTDQRADLGARVRNAHAQEKRLLDLLSDRTGTLSDVITAEKSLAEVRERIERLEAQQATLDHQISFATVTVHLVPLSPEKKSESVSERIAVAGRNGIATLGEVLVALAILGASAGPTLALVALVAYVVYRLARAWRARRPAPAPAPVASGMPYPRG